MFLWPGCDRLPGLDLCARARSVVADQGCRGQRYHGSMYYGWLHAAGSRVLYVY